MTRVRAITAHITSETLTNATQIMYRVKKKHVFPADIHWLAKSYIIFFQGLKKTSFLSHY